MHGFSPQLWSVAEAWCASAGVYSLDHLDTRQLVWAFVFALDLKHGGPNFIVLMTRLRAWTGVGNVRCIRLLGLVGPLLCRA